MEPVIVSETPDTSFIKLSTGVVLHRKPVNVLRIQAIAMQFKAPDLKDYRVYDEENKRYLDNPDHPDYKKALEKVAEDQGLAILNALIALGTESYSVPKHIPAVESEQWVEECVFLGIPVNTSNSLSRYIDWVKYVAVGDVEDMTLISNAVTPGNSEAKVAAAMATFPGNTMGQSDTNSTAK